MSGQVELAKLLFAQSWEDPRSDRKALAIKPGSRIVTITSGACNTLSFLLDGPAEIVAVDINPAQTYLAELKIATMRVLDHSEFRKFLGADESSERWNTYTRIRTKLSPEARTFWDAKEGWIKAGLLSQGKYESFISGFRFFLRLLQGNKRIDGLFNQSSISAQRDYFDKIWNTRRWRAIFQLFFNKRVLARRGLDAQYFKFDDGSRSFAESFFRRTRHSMREIPSDTNYFLSSYLLGSYLPGACPEYLLPKEFEIIKSRLSRVSLVTADLKKWLATQPDRSIDGFSLSNICELMDDRDTRELFSQVARTGKIGARICFRNLMVPRGVPTELNSRIRRNDSLSAELLNEDRSFVYGKVDAMEIIG
jgi:S-adenosylmethionine-diacylglycerol 3-amino-3-carboxypropyl transferase